MHEAKTSDYAADARARKLADAQALAIDDALISRLVEAFYTRVRNDDLLGPVFSASVADWTPHLAKMKDFWASITMESGRYHGQPMQQHIAIGGLEQRHFDRWLNLWRETVESIVPNTQAAEQFRSAADRIAQSLLIGITRGGAGAIIQSRRNSYVGGS